MPTNLAPVSDRATKAVLSVLAAQADGEGRVTGIPRSAIADQTGYAPRTVTKVIAVLRETGRITGGQPGVGGIAEYVIVDEELRKVAA